MEREEEGADGQGSRSSGADALLSGCAAGDRGALDGLMTMVQSELRLIARRRMRKLRRAMVGDGLSVTLETAGLINEAYMRLVRQRNRWQNRAHFFGVAAIQMRYICAEYARGHRARRRGADTSRVPVTDDVASEGSSLEAIDLLALDEALTRLERLDPRQAKVVQLKYFGGLTDVEVGEALGLSERTVKRDWRSARAWLFRELGGGGPKPGASD